MAVRAAGWCFASEAAQILGIEDRWAEEYEGARDADLDLAVVVTVADALANPAIAAVNVGIIYEHDEYEILEGTEPRLIVKPKLGERGEPIAFYAITHWAGGVPTFEVRTVAEVEAHRNKYSEAWKAGGRAAAIWREHFSAMAMKTVLHIEKRKWPIKVDSVADEDDVIDVRPVRSEMRDVTPAGDDPVLEQSPAPRGRGSRLAAFAAE